MDGAGEVSLGQASIAAFLAALERQGYRGAFSEDGDMRSVFGTDNSVYELVPRAVLFPREPDDLNRIMRAASICKLPLAARGGGTGTNGQSLTDQIVVDCSRYLTRIEMIDPEARTAIVQPGVILEQLNTAAAAHGLFFGPTVSTAAQATLGGMAATDASGKGSRVFGRTSDHILAMDVVLSDGSDWHAAPLTGAELEQVCAQDGIAGRVHRSLRDICAQERDEIARVFPDMNRGLTGYNLRDAMTADGGMVLSRLLAGSEGTLALTKRMKLRLLPKAPLRALLVLAYDDALAALADAGRLTQADPTAVEFIDDKILGLAQDDDVWADIAPILDISGDRPVKGMNFVEVQAQDRAELAAAIARLEAFQADAPASVISANTVEDAKVISQVWALRAKCVGLLGRMDPTRQGTPFVEDAAVPVEHLPDFVAGFREILDQRGLAYGMFGHADVGCIHVRPALNMRQPQDAARIRDVSDAVEALARAHGGVLWGEHGKGFRGEFVPNVFGDRLYQALCQIKAAFDPDNLLNPGKIATPSPQAALTALDAVPFRGPRDAQIAPQDLSDFGKAVQCNGNGACFNRTVSDAMCPSYKATNDRRYAPKGRAALLRDWLRLRDGDDRAAQTTAEEALYKNLALCLSCKACASRCPVKVDIPAMKSKFLAQYFASRRRPLRHRLLLMMEPLGALMRTAPGLFNVGLRLMRPLSDRIGLVDLPHVAPARKRRAVNRAGKSVLLVADNFNATFDGSVIEAAEIVLEALGYRVTRLSGLASGKAEAVLGFRDRFQRIARQRYNSLMRHAARYDALVEIEPAISAMAGDDYAQLGLRCDTLWSIDRFLAEEIRAGDIRLPRLARAEDAVLLAHCTERTADPAVSTRWQAIFDALGLRLAVQETGCCGMAGTFGHEKSNLAMSKQLFEMHWADEIADPTRTPLATGFSCRSQVKRFAGARALHPLEYLSRKIAQQDHPAMR
ncbi:FAD-binding and (Fe-S)-binding domain-containing protein [Phaeobacter sp. HF9A]|uniref:FAD-binding and (Fe-S)-binding domain-containing protein n=1 Tax=Phaeobacter sp. HF9A TaxID=2721561 RepID=UPI0014305341|nr:FAD-binding and (Fe-S)-binding domain-containing protein [Phaeobacter sp. HF9A]NIZ12566.1 FAD-binding oxidoreductase [Phaeobacter sp. HF9A]